MTGAGSKAELLATRKAELNELITKAGLDLRPEFYGVSKDSTLTRYLVARKFDVEASFKVGSAASCAASCAPAVASLRI